MPTKKISDFSEKTDPVVGDKFLLEQSDGSYLYAQLSSLLNTPKLWPSEIKTAEFTLVAGDSGKVFIINAVDVKCNLPATALGIMYFFVVQTVSTTTGFHVSPVTADSVDGGTDNKDLINTAASDAIGDGLILIADGVAGWVALKLGTWAAEA